MKRALALAVLCCAPWCAKSQIPVNEAVGGVAVNAPAPGYPITARRNHWTGAGIFICKVRPDGTVSSVDVRQSTGHEILDQAAIAALRQWRFKMRGGNLMKIPVNFTMSAVRHRMAGAMISD